MVQSVEGLHSEFHAITIFPAKLEILGQGHVEVERSWTIPQGWRRIAYAQRIDGG